MRYLYILLLGLLPFIGMGQAVEEFGARFVITDATLIPSTDSFYITGFLRHPRASFNGDSVMVGDIIVDADCNIFTIDSILGTVSNTIEVRVMPADTTVNTVRKATGGILRANAPPNGTFTLPANVPIEMLDCLINYNFKSIVSGGSDVDTSGFNRQFYISNDSLFIVDDSTTFFVDLSVYADSSIYNLLPYQDVSVDVDSNSLVINNLDSLLLTGVNGSYFYMYPDVYNIGIYGNGPGGVADLEVSDGTIQLDAGNRIELFAPYVYILTDTLDATGVTTFLGFPVGNSIFNNLPLGDVTIDANTNTLEITGLTSLYFETDATGTSINLTDNDIRFNSSGGAELELLYASTIITSDTLNVSNVPLILSTGPSMELQFAGDAYLNVGVDLSIDVQGTVEIFSSPNTAITGDSVTMTIGGIGGSAEGVLVQAVSGANLELWRNQVELINGYNTGIHGEFNSLQLLGDTLDATGVTTFLGFPYGIDSISYYGDSLRVYQDGNLTYPFTVEIVGGAGFTPSIRNDLPTENVTIDPNTFNLVIGTDAANNSGKFEFRTLTVDTQDAIIYAGSRDSSSIVAGEGFAMDAFIASFGAEDGIIGVNYDYFGTVYNNALFGDSSIISSYPGAELALFVSNLPTAASTSNKVVLVQDLTTDRVYQISLDSLGGATLATNGLTMSGDTVILGGTINRATSFSGNYQWDWTGTLNGQALVTITNAGTTSGGINASGTTYGVRGTSDSYGLYGVSTIGYGVYATATTGTGIIATTTTGLPVDAQATSAITNTSKTIAKITHQTSGTPAANYGADWETVLESTTTNQTASKLRTIWTDPANATRTSRFEVQLLDSTILATKFAVSGQGQIILDGYANGYFDNQDSSLYVATFDNRGYMWMTPRDSVAGISSSILNNLPLGNVTIDADENSLTIDSVGVLTLRSFDTSDSSKHELFLTDATAQLRSTYVDGSYSALSAAVAAMSMTFYDDTDTSYGIFQANASQAYMAFSENTAVPEGGVWAKEDTVGIGHITGDTRIIEVSDLSNISTADIKFFEKYYWANATPSVTSGDTAIHVWVGTGAAATPMFIDKDQFGGSTPDLSRTVISDTIFLGADYARSSGLYYFRDSLVGTADDTITVDLKKRNFTFCEFDLTSAASTVVISSMTNLYSSLSISYPLKEGEISAHTFYFTNPTSISVKWPSNFYDYGTRAAMGTDVLITSTRYNCTYDGISKFYCQ